jgi:ABC-2 type transport system permease protein
LRSPKPPFVWLLEKEFRELMVSRAWWVLLLLMGPLVGMSFISSVRTYGEVSAGVGEALSPLIGVWAPTFSACELVAVFLLPFVAIRLVAGDRESGALKLELQQGMSSLTRMAAKAIVLLTGWIVAMLPPLSAILLWRSYGGSVYPPELCTLAIGHMLNAGLTIGLAAAMAALTEHHSTAAILTLGVTIGTWIVSFMGSVQGGLWESAAGYTPAAMVSEFQHGLVRIDVVLIAVVLTLTGLALAAIWMRLGVRVRRRIYESGGITILAAALIFGCSFLNANWDTSESRGNSFPEPDERALRQIRSPLLIEVHLAAEDPRRTDLEAHTLSKLRRIMPHLKIRYIAATSIGLFEQANPGYGEIWYQVEGRRTMTRATTAESALEAIYGVAGVTPPVESDEVFRGHPLVVPTTGASILFYLVWPGVFLASGILARRRLT